MDLAGEYLQRAALGLSGRWSPAGDHQGPQPQRLALSDTAVAGIVATSVAAVAAALAAVLAGVAVGLDALAAGLAALALGAVAAADAAVAAGVAVRAAAMVLLGPGPRRLAGEPPGRGRRAPAPALAAQRRRPPGGLRAPVPGW